MVTIKIVRTLIKIHLSKIIIKKAKMTLHQILLRIGSVQIITKMEGTVNMMIDQDKTKTTIGKINIIQ